MASAVVGYICCGSAGCTYPNAQVKETKAVFQGKKGVMVWCPDPDCQTQAFPRSPIKWRNIRMQMRPIDDDEAKSESEVEEVTAPAPVITKKTYAQEMGWE